MGKKEGIKSKEEIVKENLNLSAYEIRAKLRENYADVSNEETINLILKVLKKSRTAKKIIRTDMKKIKEEKKEIDTER